MKLFNNTINITIIIIIIIIIVIIILLTVHNNGGHSPWPTLLIAPSFSVISSPSNKIITSVWFIRCLEKLCDFVFTTNL